LDTTLTPKKKKMVWDKEVQIGLAQNHLERKQKELLDLQQMKGTYGDELEGEDKARRKREIKEVQLQIIVIRARLSRIKQGKKG
jgi:hypothetical protein